MNHLSFIVLLLLGYLAITESLAIGNILAGLIVAAVITLLLRPRWTPVRPLRLPGMIWALLQYIVLLAIEIIRNGLFVARVVLRPSIKPRAAIVAVPSSCGSDLCTAAAAHGITVSPGELVVEVGRGQVMYVHCLDLRAEPEQMIAANRRREMLLRRIID